MTRALLNWTATMADPVERALLRLRQLPREPGTRRLLHPYPVRSKDEYKQHTTNRALNASIESAELTPVLTRSVRLVAIQHTVDMARVVEYVLQPQLQVPGTRHHLHKGLVDAPVVVQCGRYWYIHDGHHRFTAARALGDTTIAVRLVHVPA